MCRKLYGKSGPEVTILSPDDVARGDLSRFDAIVTGVRAWNTRSDLRSNYQRLFDYVQNGGTMVSAVQRGRGRFLRRRFRRCSNMWARIP